MTGCILKCGVFTDKEIELNGHRNIVEVVRSTSELRENPIPATNKGGGYTVVLYDFVEYVDGVGIYKSEIKQ